MDKKMNFSDHLDVRVGKAFAMLGFISRLSFEFRDPFTLKSLYTSLVPPNLENVRLFYDVRVGKVELCRYGLYDILCVAWVERILMIYHPMCKDMLRTQ
jgi:hypothetical protein